MRRCRSIRSSALPAYRVLKSSLALGVLYAEGSRRYLESLSTYTRRRMTQAAKAVVDEVLLCAGGARHALSGLLFPDPQYFWEREQNSSTACASSSRAWRSHRCPNGQYVPPTLNVAAEKEIVCPTCGVHFFAPGAEDLAFNSHWGLSQMQRHGSDPNG